MIRALRLSLFYFILNSLPLTRGFGLYLDGKNMGRQCQNLYQSSKYGFSQTESMFDSKYLWYKTKLKKLIKTEIISKDIFDVDFRNSMNDNKQPWSSMRTDRMKNMTMFASFLIFIPLFLKMTSRARRFRLTRLRLIKIICDGIRFCRECLPYLWVQQHMGHVQDRRRS